MTIQYKKRDLVNIINHPEFTGRVAIVDELANSYGACWVYLFGKPWSYQRHELQGNQMEIWIRSESCA